jgi:Fur family peroxide stress response transcriptional regulator
MTPQRLAICELLVSNQEHPTATQIFNLIKSRFPSLSLATVYNTLETLVNLGCVNVLGNVGDGTIHYDANIEPHINLACVSCHKIEDIPSTFAQDMENQISSSSGYKLLGARVLYYGLCTSCQVKQD